MQRIASIADRATEFVAVMVALALPSVVVLGISSRLMNAPLIWTDELARYLMVWLALLGWMIASRRGAHIRITFLIDLLPRGLRVATEVLIQLALVLFGAVLAWHSFELIDRSWDVEAVSIPIPSAVIYILVPLCGITVVAQAISDIVRTVRRGGPTTEPEVQATM
jgi:TRAP-type C4-dicarboxylate transport system permease small subunit